MGTVDPFASSSSSNLNKVASLVESMGGVSAGSGFLAASLLSASSSGLPALEIPCLPEMPLLVVTVDGGEGAPVLLEGEVRQLAVCLTNASSVVVTEAHMTVGGRQKEQVILFGQEKLSEALPLLPGSSVTIPVRVLAQREVVMEGEGEEGGGTKDESSVVLMVYYAGE